MNEELPAASVWQLAGGTPTGTCNCPMFSQPKSAMQQQAAKLFQQHWRHLKENYLNSTFEKGRQITGTKASVSLYCATNIISQLMFGTGRNKCTVFQWKASGDT
jgi:hypothetical protein